MESGGIANLDEFVAAHRPEWDAPDTGYVNGAQGVLLLTGAASPQAWQFWNTFDNYIHLIGDARLWAALGAETVYYRDVWRGCPRPIWRCLRSWPPMSGNGRH